MAWWKEKFKEDFLETELNIQNRTDQDYTVFKKRIKQVKKTVIQGKPKAQEENGKKMYVNFQENHKPFYRNLRNIRREQEPVIRHIKRRATIFSLTTKKELNAGQNSSRISGS